MDVWVLIVMYSGAKILLRRFEQGDISFTTPNAI